MGDSEILLCCIIFKTARYFLSAFKSRLETRKKQWVPSQILYVAAQCLIKGREKSWCRAFLFGEADSFCYSFCQFNKDWLVEICTYAAIRIAKLEFDEQTYLLYFILSPWLSIGNFPWKTENKVFFLVKYFVLWNSPSMWLVELLFCCPEETPWARQLIQEST